MKQVVMRELGWWREEKHNEPAEGKNWMDSETPWGPGESGWSEKNKRRADYKHLSEREQSRAAAVNLIKPERDWRKVSEAWQDKTQEHTREPNTNHRTGQSGEVLQLPIICQNVLFGARIVSSEKQLNVEAEFQMKTNSPEARGRRSERVHVSRTPVPRIAH